MTSKKAILYSTGDPTQNGIVLATGTQAEMTALLTKFSGASADGGLNVGTDLEASGSLDIVGLTDSDITAGDIVVPQAAYYGPTP